MKPTYQDLARKLRHAHGAAARYSAEYRDSPTAKEIADTLAAVDEAREKGAANLRELDCLLEAAVATGWASPPDVPSIRAKAIRERRGWACFEKDGKRAEIEVDLDGEGMIRATKKTCVEFDTDIVLDAFNKITSKP